MNLSTSVDVVQVCTCVSVYLFVIVLYCTHGHGVMDRSGSSILHAAPFL